MMKITENFHPVSVHISKPDLKLIDDLAILHGVKRTVILRMALAKGLSRSLRAYPDLAKRYHDMISKPDLLNAEGCDASA
jgi:hypothetical protein